uniref:Putative methyltransferase n=1 Tax=viral metagenome TaxID=1070528 RepID=A0A6M3LPD1_9ZZZZ
MCSRGDIIELQITEFETDFYNQNLKDAISIKNSVFSMLYYYALRCINNLMSQRILDIGCGSGLIAEILESIYFKRSQYLGIDFSEKRIAIAKSLSTFNFRLMNIKSDEYYSILKDFDVFLLLEVLEHIKNDLLILERIPITKRVIFSVPSYESKSHVRCFSSSDEVFGRYNNLVLFDVITTFYLPKSINKIFLCSGVRHGF